MENITAHKDEVLEIIRQNRTTHQGIYEEAVDAYRIAAIAELNRNIDALVAGKIIRVVISSPVPEIHLEDYDRAIRILELSVGETIELTESDVAQYIMDDWGWKRAFTASTASYVAR